MPLTLEDCPIITCDACVKGIWVDCNGSHWKCFWCKGRGKRYDPVVWAKIKAQSEQSEQPGAPVILDEAA
jgi:hypothetical protein